MNEMIKRIKVPLHDGQLEAVVEAIKYGQLASGPHLALLEQKLSELFDKKYVVLTANGYAALFLALKASVKPKAHVATVGASTCFAMVNAIKSADCELQYRDMDISSASFSENTFFGEYPEAVVVPDHFGIIAPLLRGPKMAETVVIEDACQSFISRTAVSTNADIVALSFYPTKLVNGIDGGALLTDNEAIYQRAKKLVYYSDQYNYEEQPRYNFKLNNVNAAFTLATLEVLDDIEASMRMTHKRFCDTLKKKEIGFLPNAGDEVASRMIMLADSPEQKAQWIEHLEASNIQCSSELYYVCPATLQPELNNTTALVQRSFSIPLHPSLSTVEQAIIEQQLRLL